MQYNELLYSTESVGLITHYLPPLIKLPKEFFVPQYGAENRFSTDCVVSEFSSYDKVFEGGPNNS